MSWRIEITRLAAKDIKRLKAANLWIKAKDLIAILSSNPYQNPPPYEKLTGNFKGAYSRRINIQHRLVYQVLDEERTIKIVRMWSHYEL